MSGPIILDISHANLYASYEAFHNSEVNDFETPTVFKFYFFIQKKKGIKS